MAFWSSATLREQYTTLIPSETTVGTVEYGSIVLHVGEELYVTPHDAIKDPGSHTKVQLEKKECFNIPPGQFAFLLTEETVKIPFDKIGFISMKAKLKFKGLVNVSGFHVDPGYLGKLVFAAFNAGPSPIHLQRGEPLFLLWISDLDGGATADDARKNKENYTDIPLSLINNIPGKLYSLQGLSEQIRDTANEVRLSIVRERVITWTAIAALLIGLIFRGPIVQSLGLDKETAIRAPAAEATPQPAAPLSQGTQPTTPQVPQQPVAPQPPRPSGNTQKP